MSARFAFRPHPLDGAQLFFHPATGTNVRIQNAETTSCRRIAPRVVMFGITNACNLRCNFCSRDPTLSSEWTLDSAAKLLEQLDQAGTLEVAFGGGEPFLFKGFSALLERLFATTHLALNVTTNGTQLRTAALESLAGALGQVRLSVYADGLWRAGASALAEAGQRWGANLLVDDRALGGLPELLQELADFGAKDASLLAYVGPNRALRLSQASEDRLASIIAESPLPCRVSVCFGSRVQVPRLFSGADDTGDCGAGYDFVSVRSDKRLAGCSFQPTSSPLNSADDLLSLWRSQRHALSQASPHPGCARRELPQAPRQSPDGVRVWQAFSGNNSGECIMVARFETSAEAGRYLAELSLGSATPPGAPAAYAPGLPYAPIWNELFERERVATPHIAYGHAPDELVVVPELRLGRAAPRVLARTASAADDDFPELRALAWKRGAFVTPGFIHVHGAVSAVFALRGKSARDLSELPLGALPPTTVRCDHGDVMLGAFSLDASPDSARPLRHTAELLAELAVDRQYALELVEGEVTLAALSRAAARHRRGFAETRRLLLRFFKTDEASAAERAKAFADTLTERYATIPPAGLLIATARPKRLAVLGYRAGAAVKALLGTEVCLHATYFQAKPAPRKGRPTPDAPGIDPERLCDDLRPALRSAVAPRKFTTELLEASPGRARLAVVTCAPELAAPVLSSYARALGCHFFVNVDDQDMLALAVRRLLGDVLQ